MSILLALVFVGTTIVWGGVFRNGRYFILITLSVVFKCLIIFFDESLGIFPQLGNNEYIPYFERFIDEGYPLTWLFSGRVPTYTALFPGWIFPVIGEENVWVIRLGNAMLGIWVLWPAISLYETVSAGECCKKNKLLAILVLFWPSWVRYSIGVGRTSVSVLLVLVSVAGLAKIILYSKSKISFSNIILVVLISILAILIRPAHIAYQLGLIAAVVFVKKRSMHYRVIYVLIFAILLFAVIPIYNDMAGSQQADLDMIADRASTNIRGSTAYLESLSPSNPFDWVWYLPLHGFYFLFAPLPWHALAASNPLAWGSVAQKMFLMVAVYRIFRDKKLLLDNNRVKLVLFGSIFISAMLMGAGVKNAGSAERWSMPQTIMLFVVISAAWAERSKFQSKISADLRVNNRKSLSAGENNI